MPTQNTTLQDKLRDIQTKLEAPKGQYNNFGKYAYRSCEDILKAVKPFLNEHKLTLMISDEMVMLGDRFYVKATATLTHESASISTVAYARESLNKKGMDESQITGATSSYARKYALNGLFAIDDTKDADTMNNKVDNKANLLIKLKNALAQKYQQEFETMQDKKDRERFALEKLGWSNWNVSEEVIQNKLIELLK